jgi:hypothetical protein
MKSTTGAIASANLITCLTRDSLSPTIPPNNRPTSNLNKGNFHSAAIVLAVANCKHKRFKPQTSQFSNHINCK